VQHWRSWTTDQQLMKLKHIRCDHAAAPQPAIKLFTCTTRSTTAYCKYSQNPARHHARDRTAR
jgi:hypothetical protein